MAGAPDRPPMPLVGEPIVEWAVWYGRYLGAVFPVRRDTKQPYTKHGFKDASTDEAAIRVFWAKHPTANIGLALPAGWLVIDVDARNDGVLTLHELEATYTALPRTLTSLTGSGGGSAHYCYLLNDSMNNVSGTLGQGLDTRVGEKHYIIVPPSIHANGQRYTWEADYGPDDIAPQPAPEWLMALLAQPSRNGTGGNGMATAHDPTAPIFEGVREATLLSIGGTLLYQKKSPAEVYEAMATANRTRCIPAYDEPHVQKLMENLYKSDALHKAEKAAAKEAEAQLLVANGAPLAPNTAPPGHSNVHIAAEATANDVPPLGLSPSAWIEQLFTFKSGEVKQNVTNFKLILQNHPHWHNATTRLWWDTVRVRPMQGEYELDDSAILETADWFGRTMRCPVTNIKLLQNTIISECKKNQRDLLREWVDNLPAWDKRQRLETWLQDYAGVEDDAFSRDVSRVILVSMIARVMHPGCHYRFVAIMQGEEDIGKSLLIKALCGPKWYVDLGLNLESKEAHMMLQGVWVAELGELHSMGNTEITRLKSFITMDEDSYIPKYGNLRETTERRAIFIGTTNQDVFLKDTGNTRFLPIKLQGQCDRAGFEKVREQLFAQARAYYGAHPEDWWDLSDEGHALAQEARELRRLVNPYETKLHEWLEYERWHTTYYPDNSTIPVTFIPNETNWPEIAQWCLGMRTPAEWKDRSLQMQIASALRALNWRVGQVWRHGRNMKVWRKEDTAPF